MENSKKVKKFAVKFKRNKLRGNVWTAAEEGYPYDEYEGTYTVDALTGRVIIEWEDDTDMPDEWEDIEEQIRTYANAQ